MMANTGVSPFDAQRLEAINRIPGDTGNSLTGSEIEYLPLDCHIPDSSPGMTTWKRLFNTLVEFQNKHQKGNHIPGFVKRAMAPAHYPARPTVFHIQKNLLKPGPLPSRHDAG